MFKKYRQQSKIIQWFKKNTNAFIIKYKKPYIKRLPNIQILMPEGKNFFISIKTKYEILTDAESTIIGNLNRLKYKTFILYGFEENKLIAIINNKLN